VESKRTSGENKPVAGARRPSFRSTVFLLILPVVLLFAVAAFREFRGPYSLGPHMDPEYFYLFNATKLADGHQPSSFFHPGVTLMVTSAVVIKAKWLFESLRGAEDPLIVSVIHDHNGYLGAIAGVLAFLIALACFLVARRVYRLTGSFAAALAVQISPLLWVGAVRYYCRVTPDTVVVLVGLLLVAVLAPVMVGADPARAARNPKLALALGFILACGVASRYSFVLLFPLIFLLDGFRQRLRALIAAAVTLMLWLIPVFAQFSIFRDWLLARLRRASTFSGGGGDRGYVGAYLENLQHAFHEQPALFWLLGCYLVVACAALLVSRTRLGERGVRIRKALWLGIGIYVLQIGLTVTDFNARYLLPAFAVTFLLNLLLVETLRTVPFGEIGRFGLSLVAVVTLLGLVRVAYYDTYDFWWWTQRLQRNMASVAAARQWERGCSVITYPTSSLPTFALGFGNAFTRAYYGAALEKVFPGQLNYDPYRIAFYDWFRKRRTADVERRLRQGECLLMEGTVDTSQDVAGFQLWPVFLPSGKWFAGAEGLYRLSLDAEHPALISSPRAMWGATVIEAEAFTSSNNIVKTASGSGQVITSSASPAFAEYKVPSQWNWRHAIRIRYASGEARPLRVRLNGKVIMEAACPIPTGGFAMKDQKWHDLGMFEFQAGENVLRLESDGLFPNVDKIAVLGIPR